MQVDAGFCLPELAALYDSENAGRHDIEFYLALADELSAADVVDIGCGTGVLAVDLAAAGHRVLGVDPAAAMLHVARSRPGGETVRWVLGEASALGERIADLAVMTGHVAQVFLTDGDWNAMLADVRRALRPGGRFAFETRNPAAQSWRGWTREESFGTYPWPGGGSYDSWVQVTSVEPGLVSFDGITVLPDGRTITSPSTLRFRTRAEVEESLRAAGFAIEALYGDWQRGPVTTLSRELIVIARRE